MWRMLCTLDYLGVLRGEFAAAVDDGDDKFSVPECTARAVDSKPFDLVICLAYAGGIRQPEQYAAESQLFLDSVARRAGDVGYDRAVIA